MSAAAQGIHHVTVQSSQPKCYCESKMYGDVEKIIPLLWNTGSSLTSLAIC
jgi:hypothetical protein